MSTMFDKATKERLQAIYALHSGDPRYAPLREKAAKLGYRLAEVWEREMLDNKDLYSWCGTVWVKL